ncbi:MAG: hypothetical protein QG654_223 [Patescibacteria group bacterium]|nr:hypothetical protein [Patescibacteria group bacterium]
MKNSRKLEREIGYLGAITWKEGNPNKLVCQIDLFESLAGVDKFVFVFIKSKDFLYHPPIWGRDALVPNTNTVEVSVAISRLEARFDERCLKIIVSRLGNQIKGHNTEMLAFTLFSNVSRVDPLVGRPVIPSLLRSYDIQVPVKSIRSKGNEILVPVQVKSGVKEQQVHIKKYPRIPSVVVSASRLEQMIEPSRNLLHEFVEHAKVLHIC